MITRIKKYFLHISPSAKALIIFIIIFLMSLVIPVSEKTVSVSGVLSATSIFYSILLGFYISAAMANLSRLKSLVATETGALIALYHLVKISLPKLLVKTRKNIDNYLIKRFDYEIHNYTVPTTKDFYAIFDILKLAKAKSDGERVALNYIGEALYYAATARRELTIVGAKIVSPASWIILTVLSAVIVFSLFLMRDGTLISAIITTLLSSSAILSLFILSDVDGNRFGEEKFAIETYQAVFSAMDLLHYYPSHYLEANRYKPQVNNYRTRDSRLITEEIA